MNWHSRPVGQKPHEPTRISRPVWVTRLRQLGPSLPANGRVTPLIRVLDEQKHFWVSGYTRSGAPLIDRSIGPTRSMGMSLISRARQESVLDQFASADFQTDWGTRGRASSDSTYDRIPTRVEASGLPARLVWLLRFGLTIDRRPPFDLERARPVEFSRFIRTHA